MPTNAEDFSPIYVGDTGCQLDMAFLYGDLTPIDLTGATLSMRMDNHLGTIKTCSGPWVIDDAKNGRALYLYQDADVSTAGTWTIQVTINFVGGMIMHTDPRTLDILLPI